METKRTWCLSFRAAEAASPSSGIAIAGGKGANLARMVQAGLPVPDGFIITTAAYRSFVEENELEMQILGALPDNGNNPDRLEQAAERIRGLFRGGKTPVCFAEDLCDWYGRLGGPAAPVAVRSSATAEDLPELSFAGQQDTYLNVMGEDGLLQAVIDCWASLWTARAIGYRSRNGIDPHGTALAVVVQRMVESEISGVLFTANPLSGVRNHTVIDATYGLGEALVSGKVEPDHYEVDTEHREIKLKRLGSKACSIHGQPGGGTFTQNIDRSDWQALSDEQILTLANLGQRVEQYYGSPQDIEWTWADGQFALVQSRAITSLFPTPEGMPADPLQVMFSFAAVQGMLDPITPLGRDALRVVFAMGSRFYGYHYNNETQTVLKQAGERLWVNVTPLARNTVGRELLSAALSMVEPTAQQALLSLMDDPRLTPERNGIRPQAALRILRFFFPMAWNVLQNLAAPVRRREFVQENAEKILLMGRARCEEIDQIQDVRTRLAMQADLLPELADKTLQQTLLRFVSVVATGMASFNWLRVLANQLPEAMIEKNQNGWPELVLEITRGLPGNPTTEMDLALWHIARAIRKNEALAAEFERYSPAQLAARYSAGEMQPGGRELIDRFLARYGGRGLAEIDMGRARWIEEPLHIFEVLSGYLGIEEGEQAPDIVFARGAEAADAAVNRLAEGLREHKGWLKANLARFAARRVRILMGMREAPKFFAVRMFGIVRGEILKSGALLVQEGALSRPDDLFYLSLRELKSFAAREEGAWTAVITKRREAYERELLRRQVPRMLLSDGKAFYEGMRAEAGSTADLSGSPVSPGVIEGVVRVVLDPRQANLRSGEILVCPGTDPSWTPLFLTAAGLIMEVGGMMTHGAVVAREYGIPAVVGVDQATHRLVTGQRVRLDGSTGRIDLVEPV